MSGLKFEKVFNSDKNVVSWRFCAFLNLTNSPTRQDPGYATDEVKYQAVLNQGRYAKLCHTATKFRQKNLLTVCISWLGSKVTQGSTCANFKIIIKQINKQERNIIANVAIELMDATGVLAITTFFNQSIGSFHGAKSDRPSVRSLFW